MINDLTQLRHRPVIRLFVSSTFTDLKHERDALQREVFLRLEQLCAGRQFQFQAIDLRWGVPTEASLDHRTMRICFDELRRSQDISPQPNFLILLGSRYGWRPLPEEVSEDEYGRLEQAASSGRPTEILRIWYRRDDNAVPSAYLLQSRRQNLNDGQDYTNEQIWNDVQSVLWGIINRAYPPDQLTGRFRHSIKPDGSLPSIVRFQASATEQEIWRGALGAPNARQHVLAFVRDIGNVEEFPPVEIGDFIDVDDSGMIDSISRRALGELEKALLDRLGESNVLKVGPARLARLNDKDGNPLVHEKGPMRGKPVLDVTTGHLDNLCSCVLAALEPIITRQMSEYWGTSDSSVAAARELELERSEHQRFGQERAPADAFVGRERHLQAISAYLHSDSRVPLVIHGASGCGKTALLARAAQDARGEWKPIVRFLGVTPRSSDVRSLLAGICQELRQRHPLESPLAGEVRDLTRELEEHFKAATAERPIVLFLDALDQVADADHDRSPLWFPFGPFPAHVKLIVSCISDTTSEDPAGQTYAALRRCGIVDENFINLDALSQGEAQTLLFERWIPQATRRLNDVQAQCIRERLITDACRQPLYLKVLFEEARLWRSYNFPPRLGENVSELLGALFSRLGDPVNHGPTVECALGYIASARRGLTEMEILEVLHRDVDYRKFLEQLTTETGHRLPDTPKRIPIAIWSRLRFDLAPYLAEHSAPGGTVLNFYHRQVAECVRRRFLDVDLERRRRHERLADYFEHQGESRRRDDELPWQLAEAQCWQRLRDCLSDLGRLLRLLATGRRFEVLAYWHKMADRYDMTTEYTRAARAYESSKAPADAVAEHVGAAADLLWTGAEHSAAEPLLRWALEAERAAFGPKDPRVAHRSLELGRLLLATNRLQEAERLSREALVVQETVFGSSSPRITGALNQLANCLSRSGWSREAETLLHRALAIDRQMLGADHPDVARDLCNLAQMLEIRRQYRDAEDMYRQALKIEEANWGSNDPKIAVILNNLGLLLKERGRTTEAETMLRRALEIDEKAFGPNHPDTGRDVGNLAMLLEQEDRFKEAEAMLRRTLEIDEHAYGPGHPDVAVDLHNLASHFFRNNRVSEAEALWRRAIVIMAAERGEDHPVTRQMKTALEEMKAQQVGTEQERLARAIDSQLRLARGVRMRGDLGSAMAAFRRLERMHRVVDDWAGVQNTIGFQSEVLSAMGEFDEALVLDRKREQLCRDHNLADGLVISLANQAHLLAGQLGRPQEALPLAEESSRLATLHGLNELAQQAEAVLLFVRSKF